MNTADSKITSDSTLILKTNLFSDDEFVSSSVQIDLVDDALIIDVSDESNADFTETDWDNVLSSILLSSKIITT